MLAISLILVVYVISIKRASVIFGVLWGYLIFNEKRIKERFTGALVMVIGVALITMSQVIK